MYFPLQRVELAHHFVIPRVLALGFDAPQRPPRVLADLGHVDGVILPLAAAAGERILEAKHDVEEPRARELHADRHREREGQAGPVARGLCFF